MNLTKIAQLMSMRSKMSKLAREVKLASHKRHQGKKECERRLKRMPQENPIVDTPSEAESN